MDSVKRVDILGCPFDAVSFREAVDLIREAVTTGSHLHICVGNVDMVMRVRKDPDYARLWWNAELIIVDGVPVTWAARLLGTPLKGRVAGTDTVLECARISAETGYPVALVGGREHIVAKAAEAMEQQYPGARMIPIPTPFPLDDAANIVLIQAIRDTGARIVLVALGAPRQERWIDAHLDATGASVGIGIGSAFDIISGVMPRAPLWMQRAGLEWLYRLLLEPKRLFRRYCIDDMPFFYHLAVRLVCGPRRKRGLHHAG